MAKPMLLTVNGTGVPDPFGPGFSSDIGRALQLNPWELFCDKLDGIETPDVPIFWQPIGYAAATFPMNPSQLGAQAELSRQITLHEQDGSCPVGSKLFLSGYSQGAIAVGQFYRDQILAVSGAHHNRLADVAAGGIIQFGDPIRSPGIAHGNEVAGMAAPTLLDGQVTGGIAGPGCLTAAQNPDYYLSCALDGDLYASAPVGSNPWSAESAVGTIETRIYNFVLAGSFSAFLANAQDLADLFTKPLQQVIAIGEAIFNGMKFLVAGTNAPHWQYGPFVPAMVEWVLGRI